MKVTQFHNDCNNCEQWKFDVLRLQERRTFLTVCFCFDAVTLTLHTLRAEQSVWQRFVDHSRFTAHRVCVSAINKKCIRQNRERNKALSSSHIVANVAVSVDACVRTAKFTQTTTVLRQHTAHIYAVYCYCDFVIKRKVVEAKMLIVLCAKTSNPQTLQSFWFIFISVLLYERKINNLEY